ncbi:YetF domain-containing protein [Neobacillus sp. LXY-4]|uniref:YetF domain-containing protein n=1 Tax=Neobacillus sp. LXY-4 TaxID=3379826 RepID=UPI003EE04D68
METIITTSIRTLIGFFVLLFLTRMLGKKQLSNITFFTYITGIALGNIAGDMVVHRDIKLIDGVTGLTLWSILTLMIEYVSLKSPKARVILDGEPSIIIKKGKILEKVMAANKLNMDDISMLLRAKNIFSVAEVDYAILEPNGQLSVLKKAEQEPVTKKDANIPITPRKYIPSELIVDGKIVQSNLKEHNLKEEWLMNQLNKLGVKNVKEVFYAELQADGKINVDKKAQN